LDRYKRYPAVGGCVKGKAWAIRGPVLGVRRRGLDQHVAERWRAFRGGGEAATIKGNSFGFDTAGNRVGVMGNAVFLEESLFGNSMVGGLAAGEGNIMAGMSTGIIAEGAATSVSDRIGLNAAGTGSLV
jgi:hypothetical protein